MTSLLSCMTRLQSISIILIVVALFSDNIDAMSLQKNNENQVDLTEMERALSNALSLALSKAMSESESEGLRRWRPRALGLLGGQGRVQRRRQRRTPSQLRCPIETRTPVCLMCGHVVGGATAFNLCCENIEDAFQWCRQISLLSSLHPQPL